MRAATTIRVLVVAAMAAVAAAAITGCTANDDIPAPVAAAVTPSSASPGTVVTISGSYFCQSPDDGSDDPDPTCDSTGVVDFGTMPVDPSNWGDTQIMVEVPDGTAGATTVTVEIAGRSSNSIAFTIE